VSATTARKEHVRPEDGRSVSHHEPRPRVSRSGTVKDASPASYHLVWITAVLLLVTGICMVLSVSVAEAINGGDKFVYVRPQVIAAVAGLVLLGLLTRVDYTKLRAPSVVFLAVMALILILVLLPQFSYTEGGSSSWFRLGPVRFQPSEFAKLAVVLAGAHLLSVRRVRKGDFASYVWPFGAVAVGMCGLVVLEGDLGTAIITAGLLMGMLWLAGMRRRHWAGLTVAGIAAAAALVFYSGERWGRILSFLDPSADPLGESYQLWQSLVALGRGGWFGVGPGQSVQKFQYLPEAHTDMIYSILGEEFGLVGTGLVLVLFGLFALSCWQLARRCSDPMGKYLIAGCGMLVTLQAVVNIGGVIGAMPLTGVPLPFMSYGRSSLLVMLMAVGLILAVARRAPARSAPSPAVRYKNVTDIDRGRRDGGARGARFGAR
jgi:cell division protein FtsW